MTFQKPEGVCSDGVILISFTSVSFHDTFCSVLGQARCPHGASTLPNMGKHVAPSGQISFPVCAQKCITNRALDGVFFYDSLLLSLILSLRGGVVSMVCGRDTNQKKMKHGLVFSRFHFLIIFR